MVAVQVSLIVALRIANRRSITWPNKMMAVLSASLLAAGVLRHYWDIYIHRTVRGISFTFVSIDAAGDLFSLLSVCECSFARLDDECQRVGAVFEPTLNILGLVIYGSELILWIGVILCGSYFNLRPWLKKVTSDWVKARHDSQRQTQSITLHEMPSSTSVFRTASENVVLRRGGILAVSAEVR